MCSDAWCPLMRLLVLVLDTNHMATHQAVLAAFSSLSISPFKLFLTYINTRPQLILFQNLLHRAIAYILYTLSPSPSPLIQYLIKVGLREVIIFVCNCKVYALMVVAFN